jgi:hypothetical protein
VPGGTSSRCRCCHCCDTVAAYESVMIPRGFDTVDRSLRVAERLVHATA